MRLHLVAGLAFIGALALTPGGAAAQRIADLTVAPSAWAANPDREVGQLVVTPAITAARPSRARYVLLGALAGVVIVGGGGSVVWLSTVGGDGFLASPIPTIASFVVGGAALGALGGWAVYEARY